MHEQVSFRSSGRNLFSHQRLIALRPPDGSRNATLVSKLPLLAGVPPFFLSQPLEVPMHIQLHCPRCSCQFSAPPDTPALEIINRMTDEGPWFGLAEGDTFEDMIFAALLSRGKICCPECLATVQVRGRERRRSA